MTTMLEGGYFQPEDVPFGGRRQRLYGLPSPVPREGLSGEGLCQLTENVVPLRVRGVGSAEAMVCIGANPPSTKKRPGLPPVCSLTGVAVQDESEIEPAWPLLVAVAPENLTVPKLASGC